MRDLNMRVEGVRGRSTFLAFSFLSVVVPKTSRYASSISAGMAKRRRFSTAGGAEVPVLREVVMDSRSSTSTRSSVGVRRER